MMDQNERMTEFDRLLAGAFSGQISQQEAERINELIRSNSQCRHRYYEFLKLNLALHELKGAGQTEHLKEFNPGLWEDLASYEKQAPPILISKGLEHKSQHSTAMLSIEKPSYKISKLSFLTLITSIAALIFLIVLVNVIEVDKPEIAAVLTDNIDSVWLDDDTGYEIGANLRCYEEPYELAKGFIELTFYDGTEVVLEAPVKFTLNAMDEMTLYSGKLYATVEQNASGFTVNTPYSRIIDMGTEFGVNVESDGNTSVHMIKGSASLIPGQKGQTSPGQVIVAGQARTINSGGLVSDIEALSEDFVRRISSENSTVWRGQNLHLADITAGRDGFGSDASNRMLDLANGQYDSFFKGQDRYGNGQYNTVADNKFVDGVFVPDASDMGLQVSSARHFFKACPDTQAFYRYPISTSIRMPKNPESHQYDDSIAREEEMVQLSCQGVLPSRLVGLTGLDSTKTKVESNLLMHANAGITFDLGKIRSAYPDIKINTFHSLFGLAGCTDPPRTGQVDVWVLVDGQSRFELADIVYKDIEEIEVKLSDTDTFLTLMVTDSGLDSVEQSENHAVYDWGLFVNPVLVLE